MILQNVELSSRIFQWVSQLDVISNIIDRVVFHLQELLHFWSFAKHWSLIMALIEWFIRKNIYSKYDILDIWFFKHCYNDEFTMKLTKLQIINDISKRLDQSGNMSGWFSKKYWLSVGRRLPHLNKIEYASKTNNKNNNNSNK